MIVRLSDNIISPLGMTTEENYQAVVQGRSALARYESIWDLPDGKRGDVRGGGEPFVASLFCRDAIERAFCEVENTSLAEPRQYSFFEKIAILSICEASQRARVDLASPRTVFVLSTTKGNVHLLAESVNGCASGADTGTRPSPLLGHSARVVSRFFGNPNPPIVVSNACTSGVCAQIEAMRLIESGDYDYAVVTGADIQSPFIISGFQSFKALSPEACRPFDAERQGLNLGEAAATVIYADVAKSPNTDLPLWTAVGGAIRNDANHISGPSRTGEGSYLALHDALQGFDPQRLAVVSVHGTATNYNDEMESIALQRAGLSDVPVSGLKGYFGHTMGAAGVLETILTMRAVDDQKVLATRGFSRLGVSCPVSVSDSHRTTDRQAFVKLLSGFGGCNAAMLFVKQPIGSRHGTASDARPIVPLHTLRLTDHSLSIDGEPVQVQQQGKELLTSLYLSRIADYPKFYKMDPLSRLGFVATELLLKAEAAAGGQPTDGDRAVVFFGTLGSLADDMKYQATIADPDNYFPSPSIFVYTLPNIVTGEVAIRNHYHGESNFLLMAERDSEWESRCVGCLFRDPHVRTAVAGWLDCADENHFEADIAIYRAGE